MRWRHCFAVGSVVAATVALAGARDLTFEERVEAQRAIERVYHRHQIGSTRSTDDLITDALLESKVTAYLSKSAALDQFWHRPVGAEALRRERIRIERSSRFPGRLRDLYEALGNDSFMIEETFVRASLVGRLAHAFFSSDERIHGGSRERTAQLRDRVTRGVIRPVEAHPRRRLVEYRIASDRTRARSLGGDGSPEQIEVPREKFEEIRNRFPQRIGDPGPIEETRDGFGFRVLLDATPTTLRVAAYAIPKKTWDAWWIVAGDGFDGSQVEAVSVPVRQRAGDSDMLPTPPPRARTHPAGGFACEPADIWDNGSLDDPAPEVREDHAAVWTGTEMITWGGTANMPLTGGERYDPLLDTFVPLSTIGAPTNCCRATAVWTGSEMIVWGGGDGQALTNVGGRYDPGTDTWTPTSLVNAPSARSRHTAVWTGSEMIVWGGGTNTGGRYDPETNTWTNTSLVNAPSARSDHTAVWTGSEMIVWGGSGTNTGGRYDPATDTWTPLSTLNAPPGRSDHTAVWTGGAMLVWGGGPGTGGRYDPATDTWSSMSIVGAPESVWSATAVWTGAEMVVWGGHVNYFAPTNTGGRYDPVSDIWTATAVRNVPASRSLHTAVWTGTEMIVWGGGDVYLDVHFRTGGRYDPASDTWVPTLAPAGRIAHTAVWTGNEMVIWGGWEEWELFSFNSGSRYDPMIDSWSPTSQTGAPLPPRRHTAVWTGDEMIVWGGGSNRGGRYDPVADSWTQTSRTNAPTFRSYHTAVWTGSEMIVWGGRGNDPLNSGGLYDPSTDSWRPVSLVSAPAPREQHSAVWTGTEMIIWGAGPDGGRYDPSTGTWSPVALVNAPSPTSLCASLWTGSEMIVLGGGRRYDPAADLWRPMSFEDAPPVCTDRAVWTGSQVLVWSGFTSPGSLGAYSPGEDAWTPLTLAGAPPPRRGHTAVWTGHSMIVWGGQPLDSYYGDDTGGIYFPGTDASPDSDGDGVTVCQGDCDDLDASVHPGAAEVCDGIDNDCDGVVPPGESDQDDDGWRVCGGDCDDLDADVYPAAPQICDGMNNDCGHPSWPSTAGTNEADDDGDAMSECQGDCDDASASAWSTPGETRDLMLLADTITLAWVAPSDAGATEVTYDTLRSGTADDFVTSAVCVEADDGADVQAVDATMPAPGEILYYLIRAENDCPGTTGQGSAGGDSAGVPRTARACP